MCDECKVQMVQVRRTWWQKIKFKSLWKCPICGKTVAL